MKLSVFQKMLSYTKVTYCQGGETHTVDVPEGEAPEDAIPFDAETGECADDGGLGGIGGITDPTASSSKPSSGSSSRRSSSSGSSGSTTKKAESTDDADSKETTSETDGADKKESSSVPVEEHGISTFNTAEGHIEDAVEGLSSGSGQSTFQSGDQPNLARDITGASKQAVDSMEDDVLMQLDGTVTTIEDMKKKAGVNTESKGTDTELTQNPRLSYNDAKAEDDQWGVGGYVPDGGYSTVYPDQKLEGSPLEGVAEFKNDEGFVMVDEHKESEISDEVVMAYAYQALGADKWNPARKEALKEYLEKEAGSSNLDQLNYIFKNYQAAGGGLMSRGPSLPEELTNPSEYLAKHLGTGGDRKARGEAVDAFGSLGNAYTPEEKWNIAFNSKGKDPQAILDLADVEGKKSDEKRIEDSKVNFSEDIGNAIDVQKDERREAVDDELDEVKDILEGEDAQKQAALIAAQEDLIETHKETYGEIIDDPEASAAYDLLQEGLAVENELAELGLDSEIDEGVAKAYDEARESRSVAYSDYRDSMDEVNAGWESLADEASMENQVSYKEALEKLKASDDPAERAELMDEMLGYIDATPDLWDEDTNALFTSVSTADGDLRKEEDAQATGFKEIDEDYTRAKRAYDDAFTLAAGEEHKELLEKRNSLRTEYDEAFKKLDADDQELLMKAMTEGAAISEMEGRIQEYDEKTGLNTAMEEYIDAEKGYQEWLGDVANAVEGGDHKTLDDLLGKDVKVKKDDLTKAGKEEWSKTKQNERKDVTDTVDFVDKMANLGSKAVKVPADLVSNSKTLYTNLRDFTDNPRVNTRLDRMHKKIDDNLKRGFGRDKLDLGKLIDTVKKVVSKAPQGSTPRELLAQIVKNIVGDGRKGRNEKSYVSVGNFGTNYEDEKTKKAQREKGEGDAEYQKLRNQIQTNRARTSFT